MSVGYRLATEEDRERTLDFVESEGVATAGFDFPTILAIEDGEIVGVLGTNLNNNMVISGPLVVRNGKQRRWTILRLIEIYDHTMRAFGVKSYIHSVAEDNKKWLEFIGRTYGTEPYATENGHHFFVKRL